MFRKISLTALVIASTVTLAPNANASSTATGNVSFSGTVPSSCAFSNVTNGSLGSRTFMSAQNNYVLGNTNAGGTNGSFTLNCNETVTLTLTYPTNNGSDSSTSHTLDAPHSNTAAQIWQTNNPSANCWSPSGWNLNMTCSNFPAGPTNYTVMMQLSFQTAPKAGTYNYSTTITATYN